MTWQISYLSAVNGLRRLVPSPFSRAALGDSDRELRSELADRELRSELADRIGQRLTSIPALGCGTRWSEHRLKLAAY